MIVDSTDRGRVWDQQPPIKYRQGGTETWDPGQVCSWQPALKDGNPIERLSSPGMASVLSLAFEAASAKLPHRKAFVPAVGRVESINKSVTRSEKDRNQMPFLARLQAAISILLRVILLLQRSSNWTNCPPASSARSITSNWPSKCSQCKTNFSQCLRNDSPTS